MSLFFCWLAANIQINTHTHFYTDIYIDAANHLETDILCPLLQHKWGQSHTHSTTNERGDPPQNYHVAGAWSNQWLHVCSSQTDLLTFSPLDSHRSPGNPSLTPTPPRSTFPLLSVEHLHRPTSPAYLTHIERPDSAPELLVVLSVIDKGGQIEIQAERLHKHSWTVCVFLSVVTGWDKGWMDAWTTIWQTCNS